MHPALLSIFATKSNLINMDIKNYYKGQITWLAETFKLYLKALPKN